MMLRGASASAPCLPSSQMRPHPHMQRIRRVRPPRHLWLLQDGVEREKCPQVLQHQTCHERPREPPISLAGSRRNLRRAYHAISCKWTCDPHTEGTCRNGAKRPTPKPGKGACTYTYCIYSLNTQDSCDTAVDVSSLSRVSTELYLYAAEGRADPSHLLFGASHRPGLDARVAHAWSRMVPCMAIGRVPPGVRLVSRVPLGDTYALRLTLFPRAPTIVG